MKSRTAMLLALLLVSGFANAADAILIDAFPRGISDAHALAIIERAFLGRDWTIKATDEHSVTGQIEHRKYVSVLKLYVDGNVIRFHDDTVLTVTNGVGGRVKIVKRKSAIPDSWLGNLQSDISRMLVSTQPSPQPTAATRMRELEELRSSGLITEDEYTKKRAAILNGL